MDFKTISPKELTENPFRLLDDGWMLLTAGDPSESNPMTVSWGGLGVLWGKCVATCYVRPQRYTLGLMEKNEYFTLSAYPESCRKALAYCGAHSGRDGDKAAACGLTPASDETGAPYFQEARLVLVCRKLYHQDFRPEQFTDPAVAEANYAAGDYHRMYIGEIVRVLVKDGQN